MNYRQIALRFTVPVILVIYLLNYVRHEQSCSFYSMGGVKTEIKSYGAKKGDFEAACERIREKYEELEARFSDYRAGSFVSQINAGQMRYPARVPEELFEVLKGAQAISAQTRGYFDVTIRPLMELWRVAEERQKKPSNSERYAAMNLVSYRHLYLSERAVTIALENRKMQIDLGGIAKGYMADQAVRIMRNAGIERGLVNSGGDVVVFDDSDDPEVFSIGIQDPSTRGTSKEIEIEQGAIVTSGNYNRYFTIDSERFTHIVNPRSGFPESCRSITVRAPTGMEADGFATAFCIMAAVGIDLKKYTPEGVEVVDLILADSDDKK